MNADLPFRGLLPDPPIMIIGSRALVRERGDLDGVLDLFRRTLDGGARWLLVREKDLNADAVRTLVDDVRRLADRYGAYVSVAGNPGVPEGIAAHGVHLPSAVLRSAGIGAAEDPTGHRSDDDGSPEAGGRSSVARHRPRSDTDPDLGDDSDDADHAARRTERAPSPPRTAARRAVDAARRRTERGLVGVSCHDGDEVTRAADAGADYVTLSPIFPSTSKPGYGPPLGPEVLRRIADPCPIPIVALGGVDASTAPMCRKSGAAGIAVLGAVVLAEDPAGATRSIIEAWTREHGSSSAIAS